MQKKSGNDFLKQLYSNTSKHSQYQDLPSSLKKIIQLEEKKVLSKYEKERLSYIEQKIRIKDSSFADIGGNTGYFTFELIYKGASQVFYFEGNKSHSDFVFEASNALKINKKIVVHSDYLDFKKDLPFANIDITLLLNVLHHVGDDYDKSHSSTLSAKRAIAKSLRLLSERSKYLVFQLGYNWKGDVGQPLFENGSKKEVIDFVKKSTEKHWNITNIGIAEIRSGSIAYTDLDSKNIDRIDSLGEFLNRPLFIMKSKMLS